MVDEAARILAEWQQHLVDGEVSATRRRIVAEFGGRLRRDPLALADEEFLAVADRTVLCHAIVAAATTAGVADACDLQLYDPATGTLRIVQQRGFSAAFGEYFSAVDAATPTACGAALATGEPVVVDDVARSPVFADPPTRDAVLAAGSRAVDSYPLRDGAGRVLGVLSFHYHRPRPRRGRPELVARSAALALGRVPEPVRHG